MNSHFRVLFAVATLAVSLLFARFSEAREEPSFELEQAAWNATNVVVATRGEPSGGAFRVLESWKGDLKPDAEVSLEGFDLPADMRCVAQEFARAANDSKPPEEVTDQGFVLFLVKKASEADKPTWQAATGTQAAKQFHPFALTVSAIWIEDGQAFAIQQRYNPGPARMHALRVYSEQEPYQINLDEPAIKKEVQRLLTLQQALQAALKIEDLPKRAQALLPVARAKSWFAWHEGFAALHDCGPASTPVLRELLKDEAMLVRHTEVIKVLSGFNNDQVAPALIGVVERELEFWKKTAPQLPVGWRGAKNVPPDLAESTQTHNLQLSAALEGLAKHPTSTATKPATDMRDYWQSLPQLDGNKGPRHISKLCEKVLEAIENQLAKSF